MESKNLSRRAFLGLGTVAGLAFGTGFVGCAPNGGKKENANGATSSNVSWNDEFDVIVCGFGAAGAAAAIEAATGGAKTIVLEKTQAGGGATALSGGVVMLGGGTALQRACGIEETPENFRAYFKAALGPSCYQELADVYCDNAVETYDWLVNQGVLFDEAVELAAPITGGFPAGVSLIYSGNEYAREYASLATPTPHGHIPSHQIDGLAGKMLFEPLSKAAEASGAEIVFNAEVQQLLTDEAGRVVGIKANINGGDVNYKANKGVILATGAFTMNDEMLTDYCPELLLGGRTAFPEDKGAGIRMGMAIGAATRSMNRYDPSLGPSIFAPDLPSGMLVNHRGLRFVAEDNYYSWIGLEIYRTTPESAYVIIDDVVKALLPTEEGMAIELAASSDTIEDLAKQIAIEPEALTHSIERYNELCAEGTDHDFHKQGKYLNPIAQAPFHAVFLGAALGGSLTLGGLKINADSQVLGLSGDVIPGLYAAGRTSCGVFGEYAGSGSSIGDGITFGRIAGKNAAAA